MSKKDKKPKPKSKSFSLKKELTQWGIFAAIAGILYFTGYHTEVIGRLQSVLLYTGLMQPDTEVSADSRQAYYNMPLISLSGEQTSLEAYKGKTIFLNFWATWCPPCIAEMPNIQNLYDTIDTDHIAFVMVSLDEDPQKAQDFITRKDFTFPVFTLAGYKPNIYNSTVVPTTYVISPEGEIVVEHRGMAKYDTDEFREFLLGL
jgi:thiol-disulfide isomerase/thioredoxin